MRSRLVALLVALMACVLAALSVPLARGVEAGRQQAFFLDRLEDTTRFASAAQQATTQVDQQALEADLVRYDEVYGVSATLLDHTGRVLLASRTGMDTDAAVRRELASAPISQALAGRASTVGPLVMPWDPQPLIVAVPVTRGGDVIGVAVTISSTTPLRGGILAIWLTLALIDLSGLALCVLFATRLAGWVLRPVFTLDAAAHEIRTGRLSTRASADSGPVELRRLAVSFNAMAVAVELAMEQQRAFVADASHQLRNPLSALMLQLENLGAELDEAHVGQVEDVRGEARRLVHILDELLALATAEHAQAKPSVVDVSALVAARCRAWSASADRKQVSLRWQSAQNAVAWVDADLVGSALDTVIHNAVKFSPEHSEVLVGVHANGDALEITVRDEGPGLGGEDLTRIGDRFWRSAKHQNVDGSGLGLSIARMLLALTNASIRFARSEPHGLTVTLSLPTPTAAQLAEQNEAAVLEEVLSP
jgi:signal transduction histidine kinase